MIRAAFLGLVGLSLLTSCLSPTQVTIELSTDTCSKHPTTTIAVGDPGKAETATPQTTTNNCDETTGSIGTIVVTPSSDNGATFEVQIVVSVGVEASACKGGKTVDDGGGTGCLVARREIAFVPHAPLKLPIEIDSICLGFECPEKGTTCITKNGKPTCEKDKTGCSGDDPSCQLTSVASAGVGGANGGGGSGMGGSTGTGGTKCAAEDCTGCTPAECREVGPGVPYKSCPTPILAPMVHCAGGNSTCCGLGAACNGGDVCTLTCPDLRFQCEAEQWSMSMSMSKSCQKNELPIQAGFLNAQLNLCVDASECKDCDKKGGVCIPTRLSCCPNDFKFTCAIDERGCCGDAECGAEHGCVYEKKDNAYACQDCTVGTTPAVVDSHSEPK